MKTDGSSVSMNDINKLFGKQIEKTSSKNSSLKDPNIKVSSPKSNQDDFQGGQEVGLSKEMRDQFQMLLAYCYKQTQKLSNKINRIVKINKE
jgi:hypothetical protein